MNIKKLRKARGLTQVELADLVGITQTALSNYERGKRKLNIEMAQKIAIALEVSLDELFHGADVE